MALLNAVIDLSHHNIVTRFQQIKGDGIIGVIHKATQSARLSMLSALIAVGLRFLQDYCSGLIILALKAPEAQADHYLDIAESTDLMVLDFEPNSQEETMTLAEAETFVRRIHDQTGRSTQEGLLLTISQGTTPARS
jgi:lysozyme